MLQAIGSPPLSSPKHAVGMMARTVGLIVVVALALVGCRVQTDVTTDVSASTHSPTRGAATLVTPTSRSNTAETPSMSVPTTTLTTGEPVSEATTVPTASPSPVNEVALQVVGQFGGTSHALALRGDVALIGLGGRLAAVDVSDPTRPTVIASSPILGTTVEAVVVERDLAYVAANEGGLWLLDVHDPAQLRVLGSLQTPGQAEGVAVRASLAFVAAGEAGLQVVDVQDPAKPRPIAGLDTPADARSIALASNTVLIADADRKRQDGGLCVVDISQPTEPRLIASLPLRDAQAVAVAGERAYVCCACALGGYSTVRVFDISHPDRPEQITEVTPPTFSVFTDVAVANGQVHLQTQSCELGACRSGLCGIDLTDPNAPTTPVPTVSLWADHSGPGRGIAIVGRYLYHVGDAGLEISDMVSGHWSRVGATADLGSVDDVVVQGGTAYAITDETQVGAARLQTLDVRQPEQPALLGSLLLPKYCEGCLALPGEPALGEGYLVVPMWQDGILLIDVRDPAQPSLYAHLGTVKTAAINQVATLSPGVYLVTGAGEPRLLNARDRDHPRFEPLPLSMGETALDAAAVPGQPLALLLTTADTATGRADAVCVLDVSDPLRPQQLGRIEVPGALYLAVADGFAYVSTLVQDCQAQLQVLDIHDPRQPAWVAMWTGAPGCFPYYRESYSVAAADGYVYFAGQILDVSDPQAPRVVGHTEVPKARQQAVGEWVYDAHREGGLRILHRVGLVPGSSER